MRKGSTRGQGRVFQPPGTRFWWIAYWLPGTGEKRESSKSERQRDAVDLLTQRLGEIKNGTYVADRKVTVAELLTDLEVDYAEKRLASLPSLKGYIAALTAPGAIGELPATQLTTARLKRLVSAWV